MVYGEDFWKFVRENGGADPSALRLRYGSSAPEYLLAAISHIEAMAKGRRKFPALPPDWVFPSALSVEQATPPLTAALNHRIALDAFRTYNNIGVDAPLRVLDMTAGLGMDALGYAADGVALTLCELNPIHARALRHNFASFANAEVVEGDSVEWLRNYSGEKFDIIFVDPARRTSTGDRVYNLHHCEPDLISLLPLLRSRCRMVVAKLSPMLDITQTLRDLPGCAELHVVEEGGECRELLAVLVFGDNAPTEPRLYVHRADEPGFSLSWTASEDVAEMEYADPAPGDYVVEPSAGIMKGGCFGLLSQRYGISLLAHNSRVFVSQELPQVHIGHCGKILKIYDFASGKLRKIGQEIGAAEVVARNLPGITSDQLRARLRVGESSEHRLLGTTLRSGRKVLLLLTKEK